MLSLDSGLNSAEKVDQGSGVEMLTVNKAGCRVQGR
jgi:hypothetical protein